MITYPSIARRTRELVSAVLLIAAPFAQGQASVKPGEFSVPFPSSSPRPNAAAIYCTPALNNQISATDSVITSQSFVQWKARVRLIFNGSDVLLSVADQHSETQGEYRTSTRYTGALPGPSDFSGNVYTSIDGNGQATVLAVNRDTGTFMWSTVSAGGGGNLNYPRVSTAFYVCGQRNP